VPSYNKNPNPGAGKYDSRNWEMIRKSWQSGLSTTKLASNYKVPYEYIYKKSVAEKWDKHARDTAIAEHKAMLLYKREERKKELENVLPASSAPVIDKMATSVSSLLAVTDRAGEIARESLLGAKKTVKEANAALDIAEKIGKVLRSLAETYQLIRGIPIEKSGGQTVNLNFPSSFPADNQQEIMELMQVIPDNHPILVIEEPK